MQYLLYVLVAIQSAAIALITVPVCKKFAIAWNVVDVPGKRKIHKSPIPLMGGLGIFLAIYITVIGDVTGFLLLKHTSFVQTRLIWLYQVSPMFKLVLPKLWIILSGGLVIIVLGLLDDIYKDKISWWLKLFIQLVVAVSVSVLGIRINIFPGQLLDIIITTIWIVGVTNSFNFVDSLDGLTAGYSIIAGSLLFAIAILQGQIFFAFTLAALIGACTGFLRYNAYPAKLFMGDSGSLFLGYMFAALTVTGSYVNPQSSSFLPILIPVLILSIPLYDIFTVLFIRWREGRSLFLGDKRHFSHRLLELGMTQRQAVIFIHLVGLCVGGAATLLPYISITGNIIILLQAFIIYILITFLIIIGKQNHKG